MCGIIATIGSHGAYEVVINGLKILEYRGYDSAGIALLSENKIHIKKATGKVIALEGASFGKMPHSSIGMGHTRWATHGEPKEINAHPHISMNGKIAVVHNGIIENHAELKQYLLSEGFVFKSDTDTEVIAHLIQHFMESRKTSFLDAIKFALGQNENQKLVHGAYALCFMCVDHPEMLVVARNGSPLSIGKGATDGEYYFASGPEAFVGYSKTFQTLNDGEISYVKDGILNIERIDNGSSVPHSFEMMSHTLQQIQKGGYPHFMLKEIYEQPQALQMCLSGRTNPQMEVVLSSIKALRDLKRKIERIFILGCGTSLHAGLSVRMTIQQSTGLPTFVENAAEFRYSAPIVGETDLVILVSQSGETKDTLEAGNLAKKKGATIFGVCNVVGSSIPKITNTGIYTHSGPEIGVASTKAFTGQVLALTLFAMAYGVERGNLDKNKVREYLNQIISIPKILGDLIPDMDLFAEKVSEYLNQKHSKISWLNDFLNKRFGWKIGNALFLGRGFGFPLAIEGALKLKEVSYIHAEGMSAAEMKHGTIALIDEYMPVIVIANKGLQYDKVLSNMHEVRARKGTIISIVSKGDTQAKALSEMSFEIPEVEDFLSPLLVTPILQLIAYHTAVGRGNDVDSPRNLAKSVTVE